MGLSGKRSARSGESLIGRGHGAGSSVVTLGPSGGRRRRPTRASQGRLLLSVARIALLWPPTVLGSQFAQGLVAELIGARISPYIAALTGAFAGLAIAVGLWRRAVGRDDWRATTADMTLCVMALCWLTLLLVAGETDAASAMMVAGAPVVGGAAVLALTA